MNTQETETVRKALENHGFTVHVQGYSKPDDLSIFAWLTDDNGKMIKNTCFILSAHMEEGERRFLAFRLVTGVPEHTKVASHGSIYDLVQHLLDIKKEFV